MSLARAFGLAVVLSAAAVVGLAMTSNTPRLGPGSGPGSGPGQAGAGPGHALLDGVFVTDQVSLETVGKLPASGYRTLIDLRPDGEASDQPPAATVEAAARAAGLSFAYHPTPKSEIPEAVVAGVAQTLATAPRPVIMYCRSGARAARVWALAEASRPDGASPQAISDAVRRAGQSVDDLSAQIATRIAARSATPKPKDVP